MLKILLLFVLSFTAQADQYYQAPDNSLHFLSTQDIANGGEKLLPSGSTPINATRVSTIQSSIAAAAAAAQAALPNPTGFIEAVKVSLGGIVGANSLSVSYPLFFTTIQSGVWADAQALIVDALAKSVITSVQYASIKAAALQYNIPISL